MNQPFLGNVSDQFCLGVQQWRRTEVESHGPVGVLGDFFARGGDKGCPFLAHNGDASVGCAPLVFGFIPEGLPSGISFEVFIWRVSHWSAPNGPMPRNTVSSGSGKAYGTRREKDTVRREGIGHVPHFSHTPV